MASGSYRRRLLTIPRIKESRLSNSYSTIQTDEGDTLLAAGPELTLKVTGAGGITVSGIEGNPDQLVIDASSVSGVSDHGDLDGLLDDDHTQYLNEARHDALPADNPHSVTFTQSVTADSGTDISAAEAETLTDGSDASSLHIHDSSYYTETELDAGQLDNRYYTESEVDALLHDPVTVVDTPSLDLSLTGQQLQGTVTLSGLNLADLGTKSHGDLDDLSSDDHPQYYLVNSFRSGDKLLLEQDNSPTNPTLAFGDGDTGFFSPSDNALAFASEGVQRWSFSSSAIFSANAEGAAIRNTSVSATVPSVVVARNNFTYGLGGFPTQNYVSLIAGSIEALRLTNESDLIRPAFISSVKDTTGDPSLPNEGELTINSFDDTVKLFYDATWHTLIHSADGTLDDRYYTESEVDILVSGINHGDLENLSNDDHPQYHLTDGTRFHTGILNVGNDVNIEDDLTVSGIYIANDSGDYTFPDESYKIGITPYGVSFPGVVGAVASDYLGTGNRALRYDNADTAIIIPLHGLRVGHVIDTVTINVNNSTFLMTITATLYRKDPLSSAAWTSVASGNTAVSGVTNITITANHTVLSDQIYMVELTENSGAAGIRYIFHGGEIGMTGSNLQLGGV